MNLMKKGKITKYMLCTVFLVALTGAAAATVTIEAVSTTGEEIENFDITVEGEGTTLERNNIDVFERDLEDGEYDIEISKEGYETIQRQILVQEDADASYSFSMAEEDEDEDTDSDIRITRLNSPERICRGESFSVDFDIENTGDERQVVSTTGFGFGKVLAGKSFVINSGQTRTYRFIFTGVRGTGEQDFRVSASNTDSDSATGTVQIDDCVVPGSPASVENIDVNVYPIEGREKASVGEVVRIKGFADGARGAVELNMSINGEEKRTIQAGRDGYFQTFIRPETSGSKTVTVSTPRVSDSATFEAVPDPKVSQLEAKNEVFSGENFEICGQVDSSVIPEVVLLQNGEVIESRQEKGNVCFEIQAPESGEYNYEIRALTYGSDASSSKEVNVLEQGPEAESFPGQVSSVETEDSLVKVELYNTNENTRNYTVKLQNIPSEWLSDPVQNVSVNKGERETVYFYLSPGESGEFTASLSVESQGDEIYSDDLQVFSTSSPQYRDSSLDVYNIAFIMLSLMF